MVKTISPIKRTDVIRRPASQKPRGVKILLSVCGCYRNQILTLITVPASEVARILHITVRELELLSSSLCPQASHRWLVATVKVMWERRCL